METIILIVLVLLALWFFYWGPQAEVVRAERERKALAERERRAAEAEILRVERDGVLKAIRIDAPGFILDARLDFEREYRNSGGEGSFGQEMSPLVCFGYRVGKTNGRTEAERHQILKYAIAADLDVTLKFLPATYISEWGQPLSRTRLNRIYNHLNNLADLRDGRRNYEIAVSHWRADARWFQMQQLPLVEKFGAI